MNIPQSGEYTPDTGTTQSGNIPEPDLHSVLQEMYARQERLEADLAMTRAALQQTEAARQHAESTRLEEAARQQAEAAHFAETTRQRTETATNPPEDVPMSALIRMLIETLTANSLSRSTGEASGPREWKPPTWDGRAESFRDYLSRMKSSYRVRSAMKPALSDVYY